MAHSSEASATSASTPRVVRVGLPAAAGWPAARGGVLSVLATPSRSSAASGALCRMLASQ